MIGAQSNIGEGLAHSLLGGARKKRKGWRERQFGSPIWREKLEEKDGMAGAVSREKDKKKGDDAGFQWRKKEEKGFTATSRISRSEGEGDLKKEKRKLRS